MVLDSISLDLLGHEPTKWVEAVQGDINSRKLKIAFFSGRLPWYAPEGTVVLIRYKKSNGVWGEYDTMPDGSAAWDLVGNVLTLSIVPQVVSTPGTVMLSVIFMKEDAILNSFSVEIRVRKNIKGSSHCLSHETEGYQYVTGFLPAPDTAQKGQILQISSVDAQGKVQTVTAVDLPEGGNGGEASGYYTPSVTQENENCMQVTFTPSKTGMPEVSPVSVQLPEGEAGFSPVVEVLQGAVITVGGIDRNFAEICVTDKDGNRTTAEVFDGVTPHIGGNGNWFIGEEDTGVKAQGEDGYTPKKGTDYSDGADGKTAYQYALEGGYTGTEEAFAAKLAEEPLIGSTSDITPAQVAEALLSGRMIVLVHTDSMYGAIIFSGFVEVPALNVVASSGISQYYDGSNTYVMRFSLAGNISEGDWGFTYSALAGINDIPAKLPNPKSLTFTGAVTGTYDGNSDVTINIPNASGDSSNETIPEYVHTEAETVAKIVNQHQSNDSIVFPFLSDAHCGFYQDKTNEAPKLAGQLLNLIGKRVSFDFIANGGDMANGAWDTTREMTYEQYEDYMELTADAHKGIPAVWVPGNHDDAPYMATSDRATQKDMFALIGRKNRVSGAVCPNGCNYGYLDMENRKLRVIYLDTDDKRSWGTVQVGSGGDCPYLNAHNVGGNQLQWLVDTGLDFGDKANPAEWGIVVISHVALNVSGMITDAVSGTTYAHSTANAATILNAYRTGKSGSITHNEITANYDFSAVESKATVICAVHGHNHKFCTETLTGGIISIGCPNVMNGRERESDDGITYTKTAGTADGTSFCIITVDRESNVIYADCVGAGPDRAFTFTTEAVAYTNQIPISIDTDGSVFNGVGYQSGYRLGSSGTLSGEAASYVTGFIPCKAGDTVYMKNVTFQYGVTDGLTSSNQRLSFYDANKNHLVQTNAAGLGGVASGVKGDDNIWTQFTPKTTMNGVDCSGAAYFRINAAYIGMDSVITVNEEIG